MNETVLTVTGYVAQEPKLRVTAAGTRVVSFRLATTERRFDKSLNGWRDGDTIFFTVTCWRLIGENVLDSLKKGEPVLVQGRLRDGTYEKEGVSHTVFEIEAHAVGHDLSRGVSRFTKATPPRPEVVLEEVPVEAGGDGGTGDLEIPETRSSPSAA